MVITGLTRNIVGCVTHYSLKLRYSSAFTPRATALLKTCISQFSRNLVSRRKPIQFYMETYRSGHNGADSKSVREQSPASSNLAVSARCRFGAIQSGFIFQIGVDDMTEQESIDFIKKCECDFLKFMNISKLPKYKITPCTISSDLIFERVYGSWASAKYDYSTKTYELTIYPELVNDFSQHLIYHEFTHMLDNEEYSKNDIRQYLVNIAYTEYHAAQVEFMRVLQTETIDDEVTFSMNQNVVTAFGEKSILEYVNRPYENAIEILSTNGFPKDLDELFAFIKSLFNYYGLRSICKMYSNNYIESIDKSSIILFITQYYSDLLDKHMNGRMDPTTVNNINSTIISQLLFQLMKKYQFI